MGSTTLRVKNEAMAASTALPPAAIISAPAAERERVVGDHHAAPAGGGPLLALERRAGARTPVLDGHRDRVLGRVNRRHRARPVLSALYPVAGELFILLRLVVKLPRNVS